MSESPAPTAAIAELPEALDALSNADAATELQFEQAVNILKRGGADYAGVYTDATTDQVVFVKCYSPEHSLGRLLAKRQLSRPYRTAARLRGLSKLSMIPTQLGVICNTHSYKTYHVSAYINGCHFGESLRKAGGDRERCESLMQQAANCLAEFHLAHGVHGDFKWTNIMVAGPEAGGPPVFYLVDLDAVRTGSHSGQRRGRDLARFLMNGEDEGVDATLMDIFLDKYADSMGLPVENCRRMARPSLHKLRRRHHKQYGA